MTRDPGESGWRRSLKIAVPAALVVLVAGLVAILLALREVPESSSPGNSDKSSTARAPAESKNVPRRMAYLSPTAADPFTPKPRPRFEGRYARWNLKEFPEGFDHDIAATVHEFFEAMELDGDAGRLLGIRQRRDDFQEFLDGLGPDAIPTLAAILNAEGNFVDRRFLLKTLGRLGIESDDATFVLRDFFMARYEDQQNRSEMHHVIQAMGKLRNDTSYDMLTDFISQDRLHSYRDKFVAALGDHPRREEATDTFIEHMRRDGSLKVRNKAAQALGKVKSSEALDDLYNAVQREPYWVIRQTMLGTIGKIGNPNAIPFLEEQATSAKESGVRLSAARALSRIGTPYALQRLSVVLRQERDEGVRSRIQKWLKGE